jgi:uncharacterized protein YrrD
MGVSARPLDIRIGAEVHCLDGKAGTVERVVISPRRREVTHLIVGKGLVLHKDIVVPIERVTSADEHRVGLDLTLDELKALPEYKVVDYVAPDPSWHGPQQYDPGAVLLAVDPYTVAWGPSTPSLAGKVVRHERLGVPQDAAIVRRGTPVETKDGKVGSVDHVLVDPKDHTVTHLVVRRGLLLPRDVAIPIDWVTDVDERGVVLGVGEAELDRLPEFEPAKIDELIASDVRDALRADPRTRDTPITVRADRGDVELTGGARDHDTRLAASEVVRGMPGVLETRNRLTVGGNGKTASAHSASGLDYLWVEQLVHRATDLHVNHGQAEELVDHAERKLRDFFEIAEDTALANGREEIFTHDLPLTRGVRSALAEAGRHSGDLSAAAIESYLSDMGILSHFDPEVRVELPRLFTSLLLVDARVVTVIRPTSVRASERLEELTRADSEQPTGAELRRAVQIVDLTL